MSGGHYHGGVKFSQTDTRELHDSLRVSGALAAMAGEILRLLAPQKHLPRLMLGVQQGGCPLAEEIHRRLTQSGENFYLGALDCSFHRDDVAMRLPTPRETILPVGIDDTAVVIVDDVFDTGRTLRAALDTLHEYGRPAVIRFAALVDRRSALLPLRADVAGFKIPAAEYPGRIIAGVRGIFWEK